MRGSVQYVCSPPVKQGGGSSMRRVRVRIGIDHLYIYEATMKLEQYVRMLSCHMHVSALDCEGATFNFQQDNASCHQSRKVTNCF